jgi:hypothetical protein
MLIRRGDPRTLFMKFEKPLFFRNMALLGSRESSEYRLFTDIWGVDFDGVGSARQSSDE